MRNPRKKIRIFVFSFLGLALVFSLNFFSKNIRSFFYSFSSSTQSTLWQARNNTGLLFARVANFNNLIQNENNEKLKNKELLAKISELEGLEGENIALREALGLGLEKEFKLTFSSVIGKNMAGDTLMINKGSSDGLKKNMPVITSKKVLIGRIGETYKNYSEVILITNKKSAFDAIVREKETAGVIKGKGDFKLIFDLIPRDSDISGGDIVVSSNLGGVFPAGLLAGTVESIKKNDVDSFKYAEIKPDFEIKSLNNVFVITNFSN